MSNKFWKRSEKKELTSIEQQVGVALTQIEQAQEFKADLKTFYVSSVIDYTQKINAKKPVFLVLIPYPCLRVYQKISAKLIPELEKKVKATIFIAAKRSIQSKWIKKHRSQQRPFSRTLTAVYDGLLEDLLAPTHILGRRTRVRVDGSRFYRIFLDQKDQKDIEARKESIRSIYKCLTTRDIEFEFHEEKHLFSVKKGQKVGKKQQ